MWVSSIHCMKWQNSYQLWEHCDYRKHGKDSVFGLYKPKKTCISLISQIVFWFKNRPAEN